MSIYAVQRRVACYVTRTSESGHELLLCEDSGNDPETAPGVRIPAGRMLPFEGVAEAALREVEEETGLIGLTYVEQVGFHELGLRDPGGPSLTNFVHVRAPSDGESSWEHTVASDAEDSGVTVFCRWESLPLKSELPGGLGRFLSAVHQ